jgi:protein SCO1
MTEPQPEQAKDAVRPRRFPVALVALSVVGMLGLGVVISFWGLRGDGPGAEYFAYRPASGEPLPKLWPLPNFSFTDHRSQLVSRDTLRGKPFIADFIFTQCTNACPMITSRMVRLQRRLAGVEVRFVSFSVDPAHDDVATLASYSERWNPSEMRWSLLATDERRLVDLVAAFRVTASGTDDPENPIMHSSVFFLVDAEGNVRGVYASDDHAALDRLVRDASHLAAQPAVDRLDGATPPLTHASLGCAGCHENSRVAPPLVNLSGAERLLETGQRVPVDRAYLRRAILEPAGELVQGYLPLMPSYRDELNDANVDRLVEELLIRTAPAARDSESVEVVIDPVCQMRVRAEPAAPNAPYGGHTVYFCSEACRDAFVASPAQYPLSEPPTAPQQAITP